MAHDFIAIEGPIGVGKTTLGRKLADALGSRFLNDTEQDNPYLESFYRQKSSVAFHTQLHFLLSRLELLEREGVRSVGQRGARGQPGNRQSGKPQPVNKNSRGDRHVVDFLIAKDRLFAELNLDENEWWMYQSLTERLDLEATIPDLTIYLQAPVEILIQRIERRGLGFEQRIDSHYLQRVVDSYERFFHEYDESPVLIVNAQAINIADNPADFELLTRQISEITAGRHYFNPQSLPV